MRGLFEGLILITLTTLMFVACSASIIANEVNSVEQIGIEIDHTLAQKIIDNEGIDQEQVRSLINALPEKISKRLPKGYGVYMFNSVQFDRDGLVWYVVLDFIPII